MHNLLVKMQRSRKPTFLVLVVGSTSKFSRSCSCSSRSSCSDCQWPAIVADRRRTVPADHVAEHQARQQACYANRATCYHFRFGRQHDRHYSVFAVRSPARLGYVRLGKEDEGLEAGTCRAGNSHLPCQGLRYKIRRGPNSRIWDTRRTRTRTNSRACSGCLRETSGPPQKRGHTASEFTGHNYNESSTFTYFIKYYTILVYVNDFSEFRSQAYTYNILIDARVRSESMWLKRSKHTTTITTQRRALQLVAWRRGRSFGAVVSFRTGSTRVIGPSGFWNIVVYVLPMKSTRMVVDNTDGYGCAPTILVKALRNSQSYK